MRVIVKGLTNDDTPPCSTKTFTLIDFNANINISDNKVFITLTSKGFSEFLCKAIIVQSLRSIELLTKSQQTKRKKELDDYKNKYGEKALRDKLIKEAFPDIDVFDELFKDKDEGSDV